MTVLMAGIHWKLRAANVWTVEPDDSAPAQAKRLIDFMAEHGNDGFQT